MRKYYPIAALLILLVAIALSASLAITNANALPTFTLAEKGIGPCQSCHGMAATHANTNHAPLACNKCHLTSTATPPTPAACAACHGAAAIMASANHTAQGCSTTPGCHGVPVAEKAKITLTVKPASIKLKKTVTAAGFMTPVTLTGNMVKLTAQMKKGTKWVKAKVASVESTLLSGAAAYSWTYKPAKKGSYRIQASVIALLGAKPTLSVWKTFKVK